jgi:iron complex outermembrane receptor protein
LFAALAVGATAIALAQSSAQATPSAQAAPQTRVAPVTTTVIVHGEVKDDYLPESLSTGTLDGLPLQQTPVSATVITRELLTDQSARLLSDVVKNDASIGEDYAPVGYYGDYEIRGIPIDLATGLQINGLTIAGEQDVPLENKQSVEFLKGLAGVESGVASAGGLIGYVTKRPAVVKALDSGTDQRGSAYGAVDLGRFFGSGKQVGTRLNLAGERIQSYVNGADGWRAMGAGAADWKINPKAILTADFEYQHKIERSECGFQLLGGDTLPNLSRIYPSTMLGEQSWGKPNTFDTYNASSRLNYDLTRGWRASVAGSFSHSLIDDNVIYAYGCSGSPYCTDLGGTSPDYFFGPDGSYDIYDYRNPGELRMDAVAEALVNGSLKTGALTHELSAGGEIFLRNVRMPGYYSTKSATAPDGTGQDGSVYYWIGEENIYQPNTALDLNTVEPIHQSAGPRRLYEDNHQSAALMQDRIRIPGGIQLIAAGRYDALRDHNYSANATDPTAAMFPTDKHIWLPQFAATYNPIANLTLYGNYGVLLSLGPQAPWWVDNSSQYLAPFFTRQAEAGVKYEPSQRILLTAALFRMHTPFFYPVADGSGGFEFASDGREVHNGIEFNAEGKAARWLRLSGSATAMNATSTGTSTPSYNGKQIINQPHLRTTFFADLALPHTRGLHLMPGWSYTGRKEATRDDTVSVPAYNIFNMGARYTPGGEQGKITFRLYADNIADKHYWKDTGASYGDTFLHLGAPTTVRLSAHYTF